MSKFKTLSFMKREHTLGVVGVIIGYMLLSQFIGNSVFLVFAFIIGAVMGYMYGKSKFENRQDTADFSAFIKWRKEYEDKLKENKEQVVGK